MQYTRINFVVVYYTKINEPKHEEKKKPGVALLDVLKYECIQNV